MTHSDYDIIHLGNGTWLVIVLSNDFTNVYWNILNRDLRLRRLNSEDVVYFDLMYRNGIKNRFFKSIAVDNSLAINSLKRCVPDAQISAIADAYFIENSDALDQSVLSDSQKKVFQIKMRKMALKSSEVIACEPPSNYVSAAHQGR